MGNKEYKLGLYEKSMPNYLTWEEKFKIVKDYGFDWLEMSIDATDEKISRLSWTQEKRNELVYLMKESGISIRTMCVSALTKYALGSSDFRIAKKGLKIAIESIILASDLGVRIIQIPGYDVFFEPCTAETHNRYLENLKFIVKEAAKYGVIIAFETMENEYMNTVGKAMVFVKEFNSPYLQIYPDIGNITNGTERCQTDLYEDIISGKGHVVAMHLKETKTNIFREVPYGDGHTKFDEGILAAKKLGVGMFLSEFWCVDDCWEKEIEKSSIFLHKKLSEIYSNN